MNSETRKKYFVYFSGFSSYILLDENSEEWGEDDMGFDTLEEAVEFIWKNELKEDCRP